MTRRLAILIVAALFALPALPAAGQVPGVPGFGPKSGRQQEAPKAPQFFDSRDEVDVAITIDPASATPGGTSVVIVALDMGDVWHAHTNDPQVPPALGDASNYIATAVYIDIPEGSGITVYPGYTQWPQAHTVQVGFLGEPVDYDVFEGHAVIFVPMTIDADASLGDVSILVRPVFQVCDATSCLQPTPEPGTPDWGAYGERVTLSIVAPGQLDGEGGSDLIAGFDQSTYEQIIAGVAAPDVIPFDAFGWSFSLDASTKTGFINLLFVAAFGGLLLNLTPCVLPVIPIKIMSLTATAGSRRRTMILGAWTSLGVVLFWLFFGILIASISWIGSINEFFQFPWFNVAIGVFIAVMAIGMCGLFTVKLPAAVYSINPGHDSPVGSIGFGVMTGVLATPCTAPFMGSAAAWAVKQPPTVTLLIFISIGVGMAVPYFLLSSFPGLVNKIPKAGPASELIKQVMGLFMLAAAVYFIGVGVSSMTAVEGEPPSRMYLWFATLTISLAGAWLAIGTVKNTKRAGIRTVFGSIGVVVIVVGVALGIRLTDKGPIDWIYYTPERLEIAQSQEKVIVLEFTAEWCLNCKLLEEDVLEDPRVAAVLSLNTVAPIKADIGASAAAQALLDEVDGVRIPLLIVLTPDGREVYRGDYYTESQVIEALALAGALIPDSSLDDGGEAPVE
jgi:thiol:disulfide interchange protein DsbD